MPAWWLSQYALWNGTSVSFFWVTLYWTGVSSARSTSSLGLTVRIGCGLVLSARASDDDCAAHAPSASAMTANRVERADISKPPARMYEQPAAMVTTTAI